MTEEIRVRSMKIHGIDGKKEPWILLSRLSSNPWQIRVRSNLDMKLESMDFQKSPSNAPQV